MGVLFFKPIPRLAIWGHTLVKDYFGYHDFPDGVGQAWSFSCQKGRSIKNYLVILMNSFRLLFR